MLALLLVGTAAIALALRLREPTPQPPGGPPISEKRPSSWSWQNEEDWMVSEIVGSIAAMAAYARHPARPSPSDWKVTIDSATRSAGSGASLKPLRMMLRVSGRSLSLDVSSHLFSPEAYLPLARALLPARDPERRNRLLPDDKLLTALLDLRAAIIEEHNARVSEALELDPLNAAAHGQAALVLGALALREASGAFSDVRPALQRMTAHLTLARALGDAGAPSLAGRYAELVLLSLVNRQREAIDKLEAIEASSDAPTERAWLRALRLRITGDWRMLPDAKGATLLERLERLRARVERLSSDVAVAEFEPRTSEPIPDWGRIILRAGGDATVSHCGTLGSSLVAAEFAEAALLTEARRMTPPDEPLELVELLKSKPARGGVTIAGDRISFRVIDDGLWATFLERHLVNAIQLEYWCLAGIYGLPEQAVEYASRTRQNFWGLGLSRLISRDLMHDLKDADRGFREAIGLVEKQPERVTARMWLKLRRDQRYPHLMSTLPDESLWFTTGFPRGTAYDAVFRLHNLKTLRVVRLEDKAALRTIAPFDYTVVWAYIWKLCDEKPVLDIVEREAGPLLEYDTRFLRSMARTWKSDLALYKPVALKLCQLDPAEWPGYGERLLALGDERGALVAFREMLQKTPDEVDISNNVDWLVDYEFEHGRKDEAMRLARRAAATGSGAGYWILGRQLELRGRLDEAFGYMRAIQERYNGRTGMVSIYLRHRDHFKGTPTESHVEPVLREVFPNGLEEVSLPTLSGSPSDGVLVDETGPRIEAIGLKPGAVIVAINGTRVRNMEQYYCVSWANVDPRLQFIAWQDGRYIQAEATFKDRRLQVSMSDYKPSVARR